MATVFVRREDYSPEGTWRLLDWCRTRGADEFGLAFNGPPYLPESAWERADTLLASFRRRVASAGDRWALTGESVAALRALLPEGLFADGPGERAPEDLTVYRGGAAMLSIFRHEGVGILEIRPDDARSLERAGLPFHPATHPG